MILLGLALRWAHLACSVLLLGTAGVLLLAGRSDRPTAQRWEARVVAWVRALALLALLTGAAAVAQEIALLEDRAHAVFETSAWLRFLLQTQAGHVWLARLGFLLLLAAFVSVRWGVAVGADWTAARGESAALALAALALLATAGHAAAVEPGTGAAMAIDATHLFATGLWLGGLLPLAALLRAAAREAGADARPYAVLAARRFSRLALVLVAVLVVTGVLNARLDVGDVAGLVGTPYGRLLLAKLALVTLIVAVAVWNRRLLPRLAGDGAREGRPAMRRLAANALAEAGLGLVVLALVTAMGSTPPALHEQPVWPFGFRLSTAALAGSAALPRVLVGSQLAVLGVAGGLAALLWRGRRAPLVASAVVLAGFGIGLALPPLAIDAYPTTYRRPSVPYSATSIGHGLALYGRRCAACHGRDGAGDGPAGLGLPRPPADLRGPRTRQHTAGDLFWWVTAGIPRSGMPGFGAALGEEDRWDLVNAVRVFGAAQTAKRLGPEVEPDRAEVVAPDFTFSVGPTPPRSLRDYRGRRIVLLVFYELPASRARLAQLAAAYQNLAVSGLEIIAVPRDAAPDALRRLGADPFVLFPVVTDGGPAILDAYGFFAPSRHAELLIDRQGYLRARTLGPPPTTLAPLLAEVERLEAEKTVAPLPDEHVH